jgi:hypothetical protein
MEDRLLEREKFRAIVLALQSLSECHEDLKWTVFGSSQEPDESAPQQNADCGLDTSSNY